MAKLRILIVDDEPLARDRVRSFLRTETSLEVVGECADGVGALSAIRREHPDIVFLDVQMPLKSGLEVLAELPRSERPAIILVTAHGRFAVDAFREQVTDFLLKPFGRDRFQVALEHAIVQINARRCHATHTPIASPAAVLSTERSEQLAVELEGGVLVIAHSDIVWIEEGKEGSILHLQGAEDVRVKEPLASLEARIDPAIFARISSSALICIGQLKELRASKDGEHTIVLLDDTALQLTHDIQSWLAAFSPDRP